jgi:hypothetical protein
MASTCSCGGPAVSQNIQTPVAGTKPVVLTLCLDCDTIQCPTCKTHVPSRTATRCLYGHRL